VDEATVLFEEFLSAPPPPTFTGPNQVVNPCPALLRKLKKAKRAHRTAKVRKLRKKLRNRCGTR